MEENNTLQYYTGIRKVNGIKIILEYKKKIHYRVGFMNYYQI